MKEVDPEKTSRARAFEMWMQSPMPMVTLVKTFDVSPIVKASRRRGVKFNMLMCWCIACAASRVEEFYLLPVGGKLMQYEALAVNVIVNNKNGGINSCDIPYDGDFDCFAKDYSLLTARCADECRDITSENRMVVGTSAILDAELDAVINQWSGRFTNPFLVWGRYRRKLFKTVLPISFQFHHVQMDGAQAARFLEELQKSIGEF